MIKRLFRPESRITEVVRINSSFRKITELEFGYSRLAEILNPALKGEK